MSLTLKSATICATVQTAKCIYLQNLNAHLYLSFNMSYPLGSKGVGQKNKNKKPTKQNKKSKTNQPVKQAKLFCEDSHFSFMKSWNIYGGR